MAQRIVDTLFHGMIPKVGVRNLQPGYAVYACDCDTSSGEIRPVYEDRFIETIPDGSQTIVLVGGQWLAYDTDVMVTKSAVIGDDRYVVSGDGAPRVYTESSLLSDGISYPLGVPKPTATPACSVTTENANEANLERETFYVFQYVTADGDVGDKSEPTNSITTRSGSVVEITGLGNPPAGYNITRQRIYRYYQGAARFLVEIDATETTYTDSALDSALQEAFAAEDWAPPPDDIQWIQPLANGMMVGYSGGSIYMSPPFVLGAFPPQYAVTPPLDAGVEIIGIGVYENTVAILTNDEPYLLTVYSLESINLSKVANSAPCVSSDSITPMRGGIGYAGKDGFYFLSSGGAASNLTESLFSERQWAAMSPSSMKATYVAGKLIFTSAEASVGGYVIDMEDRGSLVAFSTAAEFFYSAPGGELYFKNGPYIWQWQAGDEVRDYVYHSRTHGTARPWVQTAALVVSSDFDENPSAAALAELESQYEQAAADAQLIADNYAVIALLGGGGINEAEINPVRLLTYTDGTDTIESLTTHPINGDLLTGNTRTLDPYYEVAMRVVRNYDKAEDDFALSFGNSDPQRLGFQTRERFCRYELTGNASVSQVNIAPTMADLHA